MNKSVINIQLTQIAQYLRKENVFMVCPDPLQKNERFSYKEFLDTLSCEDFFVSIFTSVQKIIKYEIFLAICVHVFVLHFFRNGFTSEFPDPEHGDLRRYRIRNSPCESIYFTA